MADTQIVLKEVNDMTESTSPSIVKFAKPDLPNARTLSIARYFMTLFGDNYCYSTNAKAVYHWTGKAWEEDYADSYQAIKKDLEHLEREFVKRGGDLKQDDDESLARNPYYMARSRIQEYGMRSSLIKEIVSEIQINNSIPDLDHNLDIIAFQNAVYDTARDEITIDPNVLKDNHISKVLPVLYDPEAKCPKWEAFTRKVLLNNENSMRNLQKALSLSLSGRKPKEFLFYVMGKQANGKSTLFNTMQAIFDGYYKEVDYSTFSSGKDSTRLEWVNELKGKRIVMAKEPPQDMIFSDAAVKQFASSGDITGRQMYKGVCTFPNTFMPWIQANHKPKFKLSDEAIERRIFYFSFDYFFKEHERIDHYESILLKEKSGILNWLIEGWRLFQEENLYMNEGSSLLCSQAVIERVNRFLAECCEANPKGKTKMKELQQLYNDWAIQHGEAEIEDPKVFKNNLTKAGVKIEKKAGYGTMVFGYDLNVLKDNKIG